MDIQDLVDDLSLYDGRYKRELVDEALARQEEITPHLLALLEAVLADPGTYAENENFFGHLYAVMLLGHWRETGAHRAIVDLFSLPEDLCVRLFEDTITEDLPGLLLNTCGGEFGAIKSLVENRSAYEYSRSSALRALAYGVVTGQLDRGDAIAYYRDILENRAGEAHSSLFDEAACCLLHLYPEESMDRIEQAYQAGLIYPGYVSPRDFERQLEIGREATLEEIAGRWADRNPADFHKRMEWWACFRQESPARPVGRSVQDGRKSRHQRKNKKKAKRKMAKASRRKTRKSRKK